MQEKPFDINSLRVASPCSVGWETMTGDERVRHCNSCQLNIYNTAEMTAREVERLIERREGRLCIRLYRRADGNVLTKDCPVGLRAVRKRLGRYATAGFASILSLFSTSYGRIVGFAYPSSPNSVAFNWQQEGELSGTLLDPNGAVVAGASVRLFRQKQDEAGKAQTNSEGIFKFRNLTQGVYRIEIKAQGFKKTVIQNVRVVADKPTDVQINLEVAEGSVTVGIFAEEPLIDVTSSSVTTVITKRKLETIPR